MDIKAPEMLAKLHEIYAGFCNYPIVGVTDDGGCLCETCLKSNADIIHTSNKGDGWHVIALCTEEEQGTYCDHCGAPVRTPCDGEETSA